MLINKEVNGDSLTIALDGRLDTTTAPQLEAEITSSLDGVKNFVTAQRKAFFATVRQAAERNAINTPVQGSAADLIKIAMVRVYRALRDAGLKTKLVLQIHDELLLDMLLPEQL